MSENLIPQFTGHPSWYVSGGSYTFTDGANTRTISTKSDGSIRFQSTGQFFYIGSTIYMLRSTYPDGINYEPTDSSPTDLQLTSGYYHFGIEPTNSNLSVSLVSVSDGGAAPIESVPSEPGDDIVHALIDDYYYLRITMRSTMVNADLTFKPYLYRVGDSNVTNLIPQFTGHPSWYISGGSETVSGDCTITANSDGSFTLNGTTGSTDTTFNLLRIASGMSDLHLNNGTYEYYVKMPMNHHVNEINPTVDSYSASTGSLVHLATLAGTYNGYPKKYFDITSEHTGEVELSFTLPKDTLYDNLTFSLYLGEKSGVDPIMDLETAEPHANNLFRYLIGNPDWYVQGGQTTIGSSCIVTVNDNGSITLNGTIDDNGANTLEIGTGPWRLGSREYAFILDTNQPNSLDNLEAYCSLSYNGKIYSGEHFDPDPGSTSYSSSSCSLEINFLAGTTFDNLVLRPYVYAVEDYENLIPLFPGDPAWYSYRGEAYLSQDIEATVLDDSSIRIYCQRDYEIPSVGLLRKSGATQTDLHLNPGTYKFFIREFDRAKWGLIGSDDRVINATLYSFSADGSGTIVELCHNYSSFEVTSAVTGDVFIIVDFSEYPYIDAPNMDYTYCRFEPVICDNSYQFPTDFVPWDNTGNLIPQFSGNPSWYVSGGSTVTEVGPCTVAVNSDGSFTVNGTGSASMHAAILLLADSEVPSSTDLTLENGDYTFLIRADDATKFGFFNIRGKDLNSSVCAWSPYTGLSENNTIWSSDFAVSDDAHRHVLIEIGWKDGYEYNNFRFKPYIFNKSSGGSGQGTVIMSQPQSITVAAGNTATFSVTASGSNLSYSWEVSIDNGATWTPLGWTTSSISFTAALSQNGYRYRCVVTENGNSTTSNSATLFVTSGSGGNGNDNPNDPSGNNQGNTTPIVNPGSSASNHIELSSLYTGTQSYTFPEDYFSSGRIYWRVRSYDSDGNPGEWSESVSFICYGVSKIQNLACDAKPFAMITWTANGQVSYEIKIDDSIGYGPFHGTDGRFVLAEPLEDGHHKVSVRVQNNLGLESPWDEIEFDVQNIPSDDTTSQFVVQAGVDASLWWTPPSTREEDEFLVYRDNKLIRRFESSVTSFSDRVVLGRHTYKVIQHLPSGYYNLYTHPEVFLSTDVTKIGLLSGGPWLNLTLTTDRYPTNTFKQTRIVERTRIMGSKYPVVEISDFEELSATYEVVWPYEKREAAYQFKKLLGKAVIVKSRGEQAVVGVLDGYELPVNSQTVGYSFTIEQMDFDDDASIAIYPEGGFDFYTDLDKIAFGLMNKMDLESVSTIPGTSNPQYYEQIAEAINELKRFIAVLQSEVTTNG